MKYKKLNTNWNADPNSPEPKTKLIDNNLNLSFYSNSFLFDKTNYEDEVTIVFYDVVKYRLGSTNDEGYFRQQFRYTNEQLPWGEFYELYESNWQNDFPTDEVLIQNFEDIDTLKHFIFFFKDETFECIAKDYNIL